MQNAKHYLLIAKALQHKDRYLPFFSRFRIKSEDNWPLAMVYEGGQFDFLDATPCLQTKQFNAPVNPAPLPQMNLSRP